jgi:mannose-6-phosphate isomerase-like protein (cupin superfamily)
MKTSMMIKWLTLIVPGLFLFSCAQPTNDSDETKNGEEAEMEYIDAVEAAAEHYTLLSEDGDVRLIEMVLPPGERDNLHSHKHETVYFISGGNARIYVDDEVAAEPEIPDGYVMHHGPWTHSVENIGETTIRAIIFERMADIPVEPMEDYLDAAEKAPDHYTVLSHEGNVRVVHMKLGPGEMDNEHSHYYETVYFLRGGHARIYVDGEVAGEREIPDGYVMHHEPWTHTVENIGEDTIEAIIFEIMPEEY